MQTPRKRPSSRYAFTYEIGLLQKTPHCGTKYIILCAGFWHTCMIKHPLLIIALHITMKSYNGVKMLNRRNVSSLHYFPSFLTQRHFYTCFLSPSSSLCSLSLSSSHQALSMVESEDIVQEERARKAAVRKSRMESDLDAENADLQETKGVSERLFALDNIHEGYQ